MKINELAANYANVNEYIAFNMSYVSSIVAEIEEKRRIRKTRKQGANLCPVSPYGLSESSSEERKMLRHRRGLVMLMNRYGFEEKKINEVLLKLRFQPVTKRGGTGGTGGRR